MASEQAAQSNYRETMKLVKQQEELARQILQILATYLAEHGKNKAQKMMAEYIKDGGMPDPYSVQGDHIEGVQEELISRLDDEGIPYVAVTGSNVHLLIRPEDRERVKEINKDILVEKGNYFQEVDADFLEDRVARAPENKVPDDRKKVTTIHGLSAYEYETLKNKCGNIGYGFTVGKTENEGGTYSLSVHAKQSRILNLMNDKNDLCRAYVSMKMSLYGPNHDIKIRQLDADRKFTEDLKEAAGAEDTVYIASESSRRHYIEINSQGFEYHELKDSRDKEGNRIIMDKVSLHGSRDDPDFETELEQATGRMNDKVLVRDYATMHEHIMSNKQVLHTDRPAKTKEEAVTARCGQLVTNEIDALIKDRFRGEEEKGRVFDSPEETIKSYAVEFSQVLKGVVEGHRVAGYSEEDIGEIRRVLEQNGISPLGYKRVTEELTNVTAETHRAHEFTRETERAAR